MICASEFAELDEALEHGLAAGRKRFPPRDFEQRKRLKAAKVGNELMVMWAFDLGYRAATYRDAT